MDIHRQAPETVSIWKALLAELSPFAAIALAFGGGVMLYFLDVTSLTVTAGFVLWWIGLYGFCGCGVGWMISGRWRQGAALCVIRFLGVPALGGALIAGVLSGVDCGRACVPSSALLLTLLAAFLAAFLMPLGSAAALLVTLLRDRGARLEFSLLEPG
jgi:hypothetical protein